MHFGMKSYLKSNRNYNHTYHIKGHLLYKGLFIKKKIQKVFGMIILKLYF
jgi:hypothetical protein